MTRPARPAPTVARSDIQSVSGGISALLALAIGVVILAVLYFGQDVLVPLALASLLSFALAPPVRWLRRRGLGRTPSVILIVFLAFSFIVAFWTLVGFQLVQLAQDLPRYQSNLERKISGFEELQIGGGIFERTSEMFEELRQQIGGDQAADRESENREDGAAGVPPALDAPLKADKAGQEGPVPVEIREPRPEPLEMLYTVVSPLLEPVATAGIVIVFVVLMLLQRDDLRNRVIRLAGASDLHRTTEALDDAAQRVGRYLLTQLAVNAMYAVPIGVGLWLIGVPNPLLWALFTLILRFIPYVGAIVSAAFPLLLAIAVDPGWSMFLWTAALFISLEFAISNFVEPWLYGASTGMTPIAVILAAIFWTWLWGPMGLLLSTPLTVCLVVLGRHVPQFDFLNILLGSEPVLSPEERIYERLLAADPAGATERAYEYLTEEPLLDFYQEVALPALALAERDRMRGVLDDEHRALVGQGMAEVVEDLEEHEDVTPEPSETQEGDELPPPEPPEPITPAEDWRTGSPVLCMAGRGELDEASAAILAQLVERRGIGARIVSGEAARASNVFKLDTEGVRLICVCYMNADSIAHARFLVRRLRRKAPDASVMVAFWTLGAHEFGGESDPLKATGANHFAMSLTQALERIADAARAPQGEAAQSDETEPSASDVA